MYLFYTACEPGATKTPPANIDAIKSATLVTKADGSRQLVFDLGENKSYSAYTDIWEAFVYTMQTAWKNAFKGKSQRMIQSGLKSANLQQLVYRQD